MFLMLSYFQCGDTHQYINIIVAPPPPQGSGCLIVLTNNKEGEGSFTFVFHIIGQEKVQIVYYAMI